MFGIGYFGVGMQQGRDELRRRRLENLTVFRQFMDLNPDATTDDLKTFREEISEGMNYLRGGLPTDKALGAIAQRKQELLDHEKKQRAFQDIQMKSSVTDLLDKTLQRHMLSDLDDDKFMTAADETIQAFGDKATADIYQNQIRSTLLDRRKLAKRDQGLKFIKDAESINPDFVDANQLINQLDPNMAGWARSLLTQRAASNKQKVQIQRDQDARAERGLKLQEEANVRAKEQVERSGLDAAAAEADASVTEALVAARPEGVEALKESWKTVYAAAAARKGLAPKANIDSEWERVKAIATSKRSALQWQLQAQVPGTAEESFRKLDEERSRDLKSRMGAGLTAVLEKAGIKEDSGDAKLAAFVAAGVADNYYVTPEQLFTAIQGVPDIKALIKQGEPALRKTLVDALTAAKVPTLTGAKTQYVNEITARRVPQTLGSEKQPGTILFEAGSNLNSLAQDLRDTLSDITSGRVDLRNAVARKQIEMGLAKYTSNISALALIDAKLKTSLMSAPDYLSNGQAALAMQERITSTMAMIAQLNKLMTASVVPSGAQQGPSQPIQQPPASAPWLIESGIVAP